MSWNISGIAKRDSFRGDLDAFKGQDNLGEGAKVQCEKVKAAAADLIEILPGSEFSVSLGGHCQADSPGSASDSLSIYISAIS